MTDALQDDLVAAVGKPSATMVVETGEKRHFLLETAIVAVAGLVGGKFLDGFLDGLGVSDLGKSLGLKIREELQHVGAIVAGGTGDTDVAQVLQSQFAVLRDVAGHLTPYASNDAARTAGERAVIDTLEEKGVPASEARRIAKAVGTRLVPAPE